MAVELVKFLPQSGAEAGGHRVYAKTRWDDPWTLVPYLWIDSATWAAAPTIPTAELSWRSGFIMRPGELAPGVVVPKSGFFRWFVKLEIDAQLQKVGNETVVIGDPLLWYGTLEMSVTERGGVRQITQSGATYTVVNSRQRLIAYGLAELLNRTYMRSAEWRTAGGVLKKINRTIVFNQPDATGRALGNMASDATWAGFVFTHKLLEEDRKWSTRDIVTYLVQHGAPKNKYEKTEGEGEGFLNSTFLMSLDNETVLPDWDKPVIDPHNKTVWDLLNEAMPRGRMLGFTLDVRDTDNFVIVKPFSMLGTAINLTEIEGPGTGSGTFLANTRQRRLDFDAVPYVKPSYKESTVQDVDRVRLRGARRTSTCTLAYLDSTLEIGCPSALETEYEEAASLDAAYAALTTDEKQKANAEARAADKLFAVFRKLRIPEAWDGRVRDGLAAGDLHAVFPKSGKETAAATVDDCFPVYNRELYVLPYTPLKEGYDYQILSSPGSPDFRLPPTKVSDGPFNHLAPFALFKVPETTGPATRRWVFSESIAEAASAVRSSTAANRRLTVRVDVPRLDRAILLEVNGAPQHAVFPDEFAKLTVDRDKYGGWSWRNALYTVTLADDRYCEGIWPPDSAIDAALENVRELFIHLGDDFRQDWLVPGTVVGLNPKTGQPLRCAAGGWINADHHLLKSRARLAYEYYHRTRRALEFVTSWVTGKIQIGDYIDEIGDVDQVAIDSVVTQITVTIPHGQGELPPPLMHVATAYVELEAIRATFAHTTRDFGRMHGRMR